MLVAPSPKKAISDDCVRSHVAALDVVEMHRAAKTVRAALDLAVQLRHDLVRRSSVREHVPVRPVRRSNHVAVFEGLADTDCDGLLCDAGVQEASQLAGAETLFDLLLEASDQQHLG
jgi:hypothetical protein